MVLIVKIVFPLDTHYGANSILYSSPNNSSMYVCGSKTAQPPYSSSKDQKVSHQRWICGRILYFLQFKSIKKIAVSRALKKHKTFSEIYWQGVLAMVDLRNDCHYIKDKGRSTENYRGEGDEEQLKVESCQPFSWFPKMTDTEHDWQQCNWCNW